MSRTTSTCSEHLSYAEVIRYPIFHSIASVIQLAQVIVITHSHPPDRVGVRWLVPGLKVYHIPFPTLVSSATLPNFLTFLPYLRTIVLRERITLIHSHASLSSLGHEGVLHAHLLGVRTVFTDHSLFGFADAASILTNKLLEGMLRNVDAAICVSYIGYGPVKSPTLDSETQLFVVCYFVAVKTPCYARTFHQSRFTLSPMR